MTAPDHTPYLAPTDLRTAEEVAWWLDTYPWTCPLSCARADLRDRLDRERRQACRRGALAEWRTALRASRIDEIRCSRAGQLEIAEYKRRALAFRAAARAR